jgi:hypothetical protein
MLIPRFALAIAAEMKGWVDRLVKTKGSLTFYTSVNKSDLYVQNFEQVLEG